MAESVQPLSRGELPRREVMQTPDEVSAMLRLKALGWGIRVTVRRGSPCFRATVGGRLEAPVQVTVLAPVQETVRWRELR